MITIKCTESEKRKLCSKESTVMCDIVYALGACKEFDGACARCKRNRSKYVEWDIIPAYKKKTVSSERGDSSCHNCYWNTYGVCCCTRSPHWLQPIKNVINVKPHCDMYSAYEGDG